MKNFLKWLKRNKAFLETITEALKVLGYILKIFL